MNRVIYISSKSELRVHTPDPVNSVYIEFLLKPKMCFSQVLNCIVIVDYNHAFWDATKRLYSERFADSNQAFLLLCCTQTSCLVVLIVSVPTKTSTNEFFIQRVKRVFALRVLSEGELIGIDKVCCHRAARKQYLRNRESFV